MIIGAMLCCAMLFLSCGTALITKSHTLLFPVPKTNLGDGGELQMELDVAIAAVHRASFMSRYHYSSPAARHTRISHFLFFYRWKWPSFCTEGMRSEKNSLGPPMMFHPACCFIGISNIWPDVTYEMHAWHTLPALPSFISAVLFFSTIKVSAEEST